MMTYLTGCEPVAVDTDCDKTRFGHISVFDVYINRDRAVCDI
ncbi:hypothetical protein BDK88_3715 [Natrinema hispanicum]|uniref:Uncharacterized protein n=1 Tax=Natrinema hispanicum TaxID=392421 RepID=A0A482Y9X7_9EURY|nr:hypothetical protein BDK88_3715 [Natrinema hispanicum]